MNDRVREIIDRALKDFKDVRDPVIPILQQVQESLGCVCKEYLEYISERAGIPLTELYGIVTFYTQLKLNPPGKKIIKVCRGTACHVRGGARVLREIEHLLGIKPGQTTGDGEYTLETVACVGACALAPTVVMGDEVHRRMSPKKVVIILRDDRGCDR